LPFVRSDTAGRAELRLIHQAGSALGKWGCRADCERRNSALGLRAPGKRQRKEQQTYQQDGHVKPLAGFVIRALKPLQKLGKNPSLTSNFDFLDLQEKRNY